VGVTAVAMTKRCTGCGAVRPLDRENFRRNSDKADGFTEQCTDCVRDAQRSWNRKHRYGMTQAEYDGHLRAQGGRCAICQEPETMDRQRANGGSISLAVDHDHETGVVRGLLCARCNRAVGLLRDNPDYCQAAAEYLRRFRRARAA
jgi:hypothetical protein